MAGQSAGQSAGQAVEEAIRIAQEAVVADEQCDFAEAVALYTRSVDLIKVGLQIQREDESVDTTVLHRYCKLYMERIAVLQTHSHNSNGSWDTGTVTSAVIPARASGLHFAFDDSEIVQAII